MNETPLNNIANTSVAPSPIHGLGLFATATIPQGTCLANLDGQRVPWVVYAAREFAQDQFNEWNALLGDMLLVRSFRTKYSFINHSRTPNCAVVADGNSVRVTALAEIQHGEELFLDYRREPLPAGYVSGHGASYL